MMTFLDTLMTKLAEDPEMRNDLVGTFLADTERGECGFCDWTRDPRHNNTQAVEDHAAAELDPAHW